MTLSPTKFGALLRCPPLTLERQNIFIYTSFYIDTYTRDYKKATDLPVTYLSLKYFLFLDRLDHFKSAEIFSQRFWNNH